MYNAAAVKEKMGVTPEQIVDYKALCGDASDNIPGVPGIGPVAAIDLLKNYNELNNIYSHLEEIPGARKKKLEEGKESAYMSQKIATIMKDAPIDFNLDHYKTHRIDYEKAKKLFTELEFHSLLKKLEDLEKLLEIPKAEQASLF
jgi:DNA polymerase-1